jgi:hypothetical protein
MCIVKVFRKPLLPFLEHNEMTRNEFAQGVHGPERPLTGLSEEVDGRKFSFHNWVRLLGL